MLEAFVGAPAWKFHFVGGDVEGNGGGHEYVVVIARAIDVAKRDIILALVDAQLVIHFGVGFVPESVVDEGFKVVDKPTLRNLIGLKTILGEDVASGVLGRGTALVEIGVVVGNLVDDRAEMVALGVVVFLTVGSIGLNDKESIVVVVSESSSLPCEHVVTAVPTIASHDTRLVLDRRHHAHTVEYGHNGVVGSRGLTTDVDADNVAVGNTQNLIVGQAPNLEFALAIVAYGNLGVAYGVVRLLARGDDVGKELGLLDFAL